MNIADALMEDASKKLDEKRAEIARLKDVLREIASQCHNLPMSATAEHIEALCRAHTK